MEPKSTFSFRNFLRGSDEDMSISSPYTPDLNLIAEEVNRTILEGAFSMLIQENFPSCLWPFEIKNVIYIRKKVPHPSIDATSFSRFGDKIPSLKLVRVLVVRYMCYVYLRQENSTLVLLKESTWRLSHILYIQSFHRK